MGRLKNNSFVIVTLILISLEAITTDDAICPIGFTVAYKKTTKDRICYRQKEPEAFGDKFKDCIGNIFTIELYDSLDMMKPELILWTDYKSSYRGGPFVDWSYTKTTGKQLTVDDVKDDGSSDYDEMCVVMHPVTKYTAKRCEEKHVRYCFLDPYKQNPPIQPLEGCNSLQNSLHFWSTTSTCLKLFTNLKANWQRARDICRINNGSLLYEGWRYSNNPLLLDKVTASSKDFPLGVLRNSTEGLQRIDSENKLSKILYSEWNFENSVNASDVAYGSVKENFLYYVDSNKLFTNVICEKPLELKNITLELSFNGTEEHEILLSVNGDIIPKNIICLTDSLGYYLSKTNKVKKIPRTKNKFILSSSQNNGYYWCIHNDFKMYTPSESNVVLYINKNQIDTEELLNLYAVTIRLDKPYKIKNIQNVYTEWQRLLEEYIFFKTEYEKKYGQGIKFSEKELKSFKSEHPNLKYTFRSIVETIKIKQVYLNATTVLFHVKIKEDIEPVASGTWDDIEVVSMKPAYYCSALNNLNQTKQRYGTTLKDGCIIYKCVGDFNHGVQWIETADECHGTTPSTRGVTYNSPTVDVLQDLLQIHKNNSESSEESGEYSEDEPTTKEYILETTFTLETVTVVNPPTEKPTKPPRPPTTVLPTTELPTTTESSTTTEQPLQEQLDGAIASLESLVSNDSTIMVHNITEAFNQVNDVLSVEDVNVPIPGRFLHLLDELGARIYLNGSQREMAVKENIALVVTDASPNHPVTGMRISSNGSEVFKEGDFEILNGQLNDTYLTADSNDLVVQLPLSMSMSSRRISFVVFRNDRAFHSNHGLYMVNSRVLSVNVENLTEFSAGEVIDIHLSPNRGMLELNESRACAFWEFLGNDNETGQWSQKGCKFIPATRPGLLDKCQCNHLTHFAEILVSSNFSQVHNDILEVISIVGCVLSIFGLALVGTTAALFRSWRRDFSNKIWLQLCIAILLLTVCFFTVIFVEFNRFDVICMLIGVVLHYSVLASFSWMMVAAILSYRRLVLVFTRDASHKLLRAAAFAWGMPCAIVGILLSAAPQSYNESYIDKTPSATFCYPSGLAKWLAVYAPIAIMLLVNWTLFVLIVRAVFASTRVQRHGDANEVLRCASVSCLLVFLFGLPWIFGLFANSVVAAYLFTLLGTLQGFILFLFFVVGNKKTRDLWLNKLKIKQTRKVPVTSSTYTNRSTGPTRPAGPASMEVKFSKPRSLESPDDSRFS